MTNTPLEQRKQDASRHPETKLILMTLSRLIRTGTTSKSEPLGQMTLCSYLRMLGWDASVYSGSAFDGFHYLETIKEQMADRRVIIGLYADYENLNLVASLSRKIKDSLGWPVFVGGPQAVGLEESFLRKNPAVDLFIRGDGEYALADVLSAWSEDDKEALQKIRGVGLISDGIYIDNGFSQPLADLNEAPPLDTGCLINQFPRSVLVALSGRGCPFHCSFCYEGAGSKTVRLRSVEHMLTELEKRLQDHPAVRYIYFGDDTFTLQPDRLKAFCEGLKELRKQYDFVWFADGHVNVILKHPEYIRMMVDAGLVRMQIGIESCCQDIIDLYNKGIRREDLFSVVDLCLREGLPQLAGNIIIGGAMETAETARYTFETVYELLRRSRGMLDVSHTLYSNFPGTPMHCEPERFGIRIIDPDGLTSFGDYPTSRTAALEPEEIAGLANEFFLGCQRTMRAAIRDNAVDEDRLTFSALLMEKYGITSMWITLGMTRNQQRYYSDNALYGRKELSDGTIPLRTVFFHGQTDYVKPVPSLDGFVLSPFEDELISLCAGKLDFAGITKRLADSFGSMFDSFEELKSFTASRLAELKKHHLLVYTDLNGTETGGDAETEKETPMGLRDTRNNTEKRKDKVLLFYPYTIPGGVHIRTQRHTLGIFLLAAVLKQAGYRVRACECTTAEIMDYVRRENDGTVLAVGMSIDYENRRAVLALSEKITALGLPVLIGGVDARTVTEEELKQSRAAAVLKGEGEITLPEVIRALDAGAALESIPGLLWLKDGALIDTGAEKPPKDLDALPFPDYSASMIKHDNRRFTILSSRGCPNHCAFCHEGYAPAALRFRSISNVLAELEMLLADYPELQFVLFADDTLVLKPHRVSELCRGINELRKKYHDFAWYCEADVRSLYQHPEMLAEMIGSGMVRLQIGIESGDEEILKLYGKPSANDMVRSVVRHAWELGLPSLVGPILVGAPFENPEHVKLEKAWMEELLTLAPGMLEMPVSIISPYLQTRIGQYPEQYGYCFTDQPGDRANTDYPAYHTEKMSEKEILAAYQELASGAVSTVSRLVSEGRVPTERLLECMRTQDLYGGDSFWLRVIGSVDPILFSYLELRQRNHVPALRDIPEGKLPSYHLQRTMELWRFVNYSELGPRIGKIYLSPYEYQVLLCSAGKLSIAEIAEKLYPDFGSGESPEEMLRRLTETVYTFEDRHWVVAMEF